MQLPRQKFQDKVLHLKKLFEGDKLPTLVIWPTILPWLWLNQVYLKPTKDILSGVRTLSEALELNPADRKEVFGTIQRGVFRDGGLFTTYKTGNRITELLNP